MGFLMPLEKYSVFFDIVSTLVGITRKTPKMLQGIKKEITILSKQRTGTKRKYRSIKKSQRRNGTFKKRKVNPRAKQAMLIMNKRNVSLTEAWRIVNRSRKV